MNVKSSEPNQAEIDAGEWLADLSQRLVSIDRRGELENWLAADAEHAQAYERGREVFQLAGDCADLLREARREEEAVLESRRRRLRYGAVAAGVVLALGGALLGLRKFAGFGGGHEFATVTAQVKDIPLGDGTLVTLGAASKIEVEFGEHERRVRLTRGEAFFEVARDTSRPFLVMAGDTAVRVLGTKFDVHYGEQAVRVAVVEGRVEVLHAADAKAVTRKAEPEQGRLLTAGDMVVAARSGDIVTSGHANGENLDAWRAGRLVYVDARLKDIVSDMNRYFDGRIRLADEGLGERQLTIAFRADEIGRGIELIEEALPVRAVKAGPREVVLAQR